MDGLRSPLLEPRPAARLTQIVVAIPVKNEADRIGRLLQALSAAAGRTSLPVRAIVLANNCTDGTALIAGAFASPLLQVDVHQVTLPHQQANAGGARRVVMDLAAREGALLMTTDGDAIPDAGWISAALQAAEAGADLICGTIHANADHVLATASGARITRAEVAYRAVQHEVRYYIDQIAGRQKPGGRQPHYVESGASLAIRADVYRRIGGLPAVASSEDRALIHRAERHGVPVHYSHDMRAKVSARLQGRAKGGMAECLRERMRDSDPLADQAMLPLKVLRDLWADALAVPDSIFPDRAVSIGHRMRASDLEKGLPPLTDFLQGVVRPGFHRWMATCHRSEATA